jgi:Trypsin-like peptidase domain
MRNGSIDCRITIILLVVWISLFYQGASSAHPDIPANNLSYPVLLMDEDGESGSGFFYNRDDATYLITARHVLFKETSVFVQEQLSIPRALKHKLFIRENKPKNDFELVLHGTLSETDKEELTKGAIGPNAETFRASIEELFKSSQQLKLRKDKLTLLSIAPSKSGENGRSELGLDLIKLLETKHIAYHPSQDVAYVRIAIASSTGNPRRIAPVPGVSMKPGTRIAGLGKDNFKRLDDVIVGNEAFVFGYPTSITKNAPWLDIGLPLLRKGAIAGINRELKVIILDCPAFYGNSGGLVLEVEHISLTEINYRAIGVVTNLVPYQGYWLQNSGYSVVVPMDFVEELLETKKAVATSD